MDEPDFVAKTLKWCNGIRKKQGLNKLQRMPKGRMSDGTSCPCGAATGMFVARTVFVPLDDYKNGINLIDHGEILPEPVRKFVRAFDSGQLPQYVESVVQDG